MNFDSCIGSNILILEGRSASGKSEIAKLLNEKYGYIKAVTCTTRDPRPGEVDGRDYNFMSDEEFRNHLRADDFVESTKYRDKWYGMLKSTLMTKEKIVCVLTPDGAEAVKKEFSYAYAVHINTSMKTAVLRAIEREKELTPEKLQSISTCALTDFYLYDRSRLYKDLPDHKVVNESGTILEDIVSDIITVHGRHIMSCDGR